MPILNKKIVRNPEMLVQNVRSALSERGCRISESSEQFKFLVIEESEQYSLNIEQVKWLATFLKIPYERVPQKYAKWEPGLSNYLSCVKYTNPDDPREYVLQVQARNRLGSLELLHRNPNDPKVFSSVAFQSVIPYFTEDLDLLRSDLHQKIRHDHPTIQTYDLEKQGAIVRGTFGKVVGEKVNRAHPNIDPFAIRVIHSFFDIGIPEVDGICPKCYQVSMPRSGFGIRYKSSIQEGLFYEIRLSSEKLCGYPQQSEIYITNTLNIHGRIRYVKWMGAENAYMFSQRIEEEITHIPYRSNNQQSVIDHLKSEAAMKYFQSVLPTTPNIVIPLCRCT